MQEGRHVLLDRTPDELTPVDGSLFLGIWTDTQSLIPYLKVYDVWKFSVYDVACRLLAATVESRRTGLRWSSCRGKFYIAESYVGALSLVEGRSEYSLWLAAHGR
ncbi:hypothetical protein TNCV_2875241 [Trichonephila clavipes]|nr:hypothetical protein TNCV_2875241 [Trichonephila clavipes]